MSTDKPTCEISPEQMRAIQKTGQKCREDIEKKAAKMQVKADWKRRALAAEAKLEKAQAFLASLECPNQVHSVYRLSEYVDCGTCEVCEAKKEQRK